MRRRQELTRATQQGAQRAIDTLGSPGALMGAAVFGFLLGGGAVRRHHENARSGRRKSDPGSRAAKRTGVIGALVTGAMWLVRARFGSTAGLAQYIMARRHAATGPQHRFRR